MTHKPLHFDDLCPSFPHKLCFDAFSGQVTAGSCVVIVGRNGRGKSSLLQCLVSCVIM